MILSPDGTILTENLKEYVQKQIKESHKESATNVTFDYKELASIFEGVEEKQIEALSNQLEHIKSFKTDYDSRLNKFARDFQYLSSAFSINRQDLLKNYQEIRASITDYDDLLREIKELTISRDKSVDDKRTLFDEKRDNWNSQEVQDEVKALNEDIADSDNKIRSKLLLFKIIDARINIKLIKISVTRCLIFWIVRTVSRYCEKYKPGLTIQRVSDWTINDINYL